MLVCSATRRYLDLTSIFFWLSIIISKTKYSKPRLVPYGGRTTARSMLIRNLGYSIMIKHFTKCVNTFFYNLSRALMRKQILFLQILVCQGLCSYSAHYHSKKFGITSHQGFIFLRSVRFKKKASISLLRSRYS